LQGRRGDGDLVGGAIQDGLFVAAQEQGRRRVFGKGGRFGQRLRGGIAGLFELAARQRQGATWQRLFGARKLSIKLAGQFGGVVIGHGGLHGEDGPHAAIEKALGEAGRFVVAAAAVACGEHDQRRRMAGNTNLGGEVGGSGGNGVAVFIFQFQDGLVAVAGKMEHVIAELPEGGGDLVWTADFEDADIRVAEHARVFDGVEDGLELGFDIEHRIGSLVFVGRAHGDQDFQRARGRGLGSGFVVDGWTPPDVDTGSQGRNAAVGQTGGFEGNAEQTRGLGFEYELDFIVASGGGGEAGGELALDIAGEDDASDGVAEFVQIALSGGCPGLDGFLPRAVRAGRHEIGIRESEARTRQDGLFGGYDCAVALCRNADGGARRHLAEVYRKADT
jgi:hypothetical protein